MISPDYFVSAAHYHPSAGDTVTFYEGNDHSGPSHQFTVANWSYQTSYNGLPSDLWLGKLTTPIPASDHIASYPVLGLPSNDDYVGQMIYVNGKPNRVGRNIIDRIIRPRSRTAPTPYKDTVSMEYDYNTVSGLGADECYLISGRQRRAELCRCQRPIGLGGDSLLQRGHSRPRRLGRHLRRLVRALLYRPTRCKHGGRERHPRARAWNPGAVEHLRRGGRAVWLVSHVAGNRRELSILSAHLRGPLAPGYSDA